MNHICVFFSDAMCFALGKACCSLQIRKALECIGYGVRRSSWCCLSSSGSVWSSFPTAPTVRLWEISTELIHKGQHSDLVTKVGDSPLTECHMDREGFCPFSPSSPHFPKAKTHSSFIGAVALNRDDWLLSILWVQSSFQSLKDISRVATARTGRVCIS